MSEAEKKNSEQVCAGVAARTGRLLPPPVGTSDWARFSRTSYCVDKTLILKDLIDAESTVVLFTRPRRFGKTTTLKMIRAFYEGAAADRHARIHHRDARRFCRAWREARHPQVRHGLLQEEPRRLQGPVEMSRV